ncbi:MAG: hypothetical protein AAGB31_12065 [Bdellovibrio sp.]
MKKNKTLSVVLLIGFAWSSPVLAQTGETPSQSTSPAPATAPVTQGKKGRSVKLNFEDELVKGGLAAPDMSSVNVRQDFNYKKLIRVRENFLNEMEDGLNDYKGQ